MNSEYTVKEFKGKIKNKDGKKDKFEIVSFEDKDPKIKLDENNKGTQDINVKLKKADSEGKFENATVETKKITVEYEQGKFFNFGKIKKVDGDADIQETEVGFSGFNSFRYTFWLSMAALALLIIGLIWWWVASSRKEDKEEESL